MTQTRKWTLATVGVVVLVLLAGWFLLVSPKRGEAADLRAEQQEQVDANAALRAKLELLRAQAEDLPAQRKRLARVTRALPDDPHLPELVRQLTANASRAGADLSSIAPGRPVPAGAADPSAATPAPDGTTAAEGSATPAASQEVLQAVPLTLEVSGEYAQLERYLNLLEQLDRPLLVTGWTMSPNGASADAAGGTTTTTTTTTTATGTDTAAGGESSAARGPVRISITARTYMVDRSAAEAAAGVTDPAATPSAPGEEE